MNFCPKRLAATLLGLFGIACCAAASYASTPTTTRGALARLSLEGPATSERFLEPKETATGFEALFGRQRKQEQKESLADLAFKISYAGAILLTADQVVRSVDSVLDRLKIESANGERCEFKMRPAREGFEVMLKLSRPIEF